MIPNTNDGSNNTLALRCYMNTLALEAMAPFEGLDARSAFEEIKTAGFQGMQFAELASGAEIAACRALKLGIAGSGRVNLPHEADLLAKLLSDQGYECATLHVGWGMEDDAECERLIESILTASAKHRIPFYVETHRATIFQDMWRTVEFVRQFPDIRFNGDFSHWYTGQEMVYGGFEKKLAFIQPVLERVRFVHGRIGNPGSMQVNIDDANESAHPYVAHFKQLWTDAFRYFLESAVSGDYICFAPELLAPRIYYGRTFRDNSGALVEECDRWQQSLVLVNVARDCYERAAQGTAAGLSSTTAG